MALGEAARKASERFRPPRRVTFVVDRNISCTNICSVGCRFCAFHCAPGDPSGYVMSHDEICQKVEELAAAGGTQVMIQGGVNMDLPLEYYLELVHALHRKFPSIHIHSFSAAEIDGLAVRHHIPLPHLFRLFREAGLNSLPGGGAEILSDRVRRLASPAKISSGRWIEIMEAAHESGLKTTATMVFGHYETLEERIFHLMKIRNLQDKTQGFKAFIPWSLSPCGTPGMAHFRAVGGEDYLRTVAVSRLVLDNIEHIQAGWLTEGKALAQIALHFGCDDMGGTLMEDKVLEPTGVQAATKREDLVRLIREAGFIPAQRDTNYGLLHEFD